MITLELASRFARDVLEDSYFAFDAEQYTSRRGRQYGSNEEFALSSQGHDCTA